MAPESNKLTAKLPTREALVKSPKPELAPTKAFVKSLFGIIFGAFTESYVSRGIGLRVSAEKKYFVSFTVALNMSRLRPDEM